jgi:hypothetical protein
MLKIACCLRSTYWTIAEIFSCAVEISTASGERVDDCMGEVNKSSTIHRDISTTQLEICVRYVACGEKLGKT